MNEESQSPTGFKRYDGSVQFAHSDRKTQFITYSCYSGLVAANLYSFSMISTGLINANLLPENVVFGGFGLFLNYLVAAFVQVGIFLIYVSWPLRRKGKWHPNWTTTFFWLGLVAIATIFSLFSITLTSRGDELVRTNSEAVSDVSTRIDSLDQRITGIYESQITNLNGLWEEACSGRDRTGIERCGPIATGYQDRRQSTIAEFGASLGLSTFSQPSNGATHAAKVQIAGGNLEILRTKVSFFEDFAQANGIESRGVTNQFQTVERRFDDVAAAVGGQSLTKNEIAFQQVFTDIADAWTLTAGWQFWVALAIACLPDVMSVVFILVLMIVREANDPLRAVEEDISIMQQMSNLASKATAAYSKATDRMREMNAARRAKNMEQAVDASVPDS